MKWEKIGVILKPGKYTWMSESTYVTLVEKQTNDDICKIYFGGRDKSGVGRIGFAIIDINNPLKIIHISKEPILELGRIGIFDDSGTIPCSLVLYNDKKYLFYTGISLAVTTPWKSAIGLAIAEKTSDVFIKSSDAPVLNINKFDPYSVAVPWVIIENDIWKMWYVSYTDWELSRFNSKPKHYFLIKYAESKNGIDWNPTGIICLNFREGEYAITRPSIIKENNLYKMWYSYRGNFDNFRIGYAESYDGINWKRLDEEVGIDVSDTGWDSEMICHPCVFMNKNNKYMLYNGNRYGKTGFGLAVLKI